MLFIFPRSLNKSLFLNENFAFLLKSIQFGLLLIHSAYTGKILLFTEKLNLMCISNLLEFLRDPIKQLKKRFYGFSMYLSYQGGFLTSAEFMDIL